jgi:hypothetical protein
MANEAKVLKFGDVTNRVRAYQQKLAAEAEKAAADSTTKMVPEKDPNCVGDKTIPKDPEATKQKQNMPQDNTNTGGTQDNNLEHRDTTPHETGKCRVSTEDGDAKDEKADSPTAPLSKIATRARDIVGRLQKQAQSPANVVQMPQGSAKQAAPDNTHLARDMRPDPEFLFKLACTILDTEGGIEAVEPVLRKAAGVEAAQDIISKATEAYNGFVDDGYRELELQKQAAYEQAETEEALYYMTKDASAAERNQIVNMAEVHEAILATIDDPYIKSAYMQGATDAAAMGDSQAEGMEGGGGGEGEEGGEPSLPGAEGPASIEEIVSMLEAMVEAGEIDEQTAAQVVQELTAGGEGGEGMEGGGEEEAMAMGGMGGGEEEAMAAEGGMTAEAAFKKASHLIERLVVNG